MLIKAHGDGSGTGGIVAVAVCAAEAASWDAVEPRWQATTQRLGYPAHLTAFIKAEEDPAKRERVLGELIAVMNDVVLACSAGVMNEADFVILPTVVAERLGNQYLATATTSLALVDRWRLDQGYGEPVAAVFEAGDSGQKLFDDALQVLRMRPASFRKEIGVEEVVFAPKGCAGLQMADILAWTMTHWVPEMKQDDPIARFVITSLNQEIAMFRWYLTRDRLLEVARGNTREKLRALEDKHGVDRVVEAAQLAALAAKPSRGIRRQRKRRRHE